MEQRRTVNWDIWTSVAFTLLGLALIGDALTFPRGARGVPGPGFVPIAIGALLVLLAAGVGLGALRHAPEPYWDRTGREPVLGRMALVWLLLVAYVSLWNAVPFLVRTPVTLIIVYRLFRESWLRAVLLAAALTAGLYGIFDGMLSIQL